MVTAEATSPPAAYELMSLYKAYQVNYASIKEARPPCSMDRLQNPLPDLMHTLHGNESSIFSVLRNALVRFIDSGILDENHHPNIGALVVYLRCVTIGLGGIFSWSKCIFPDEVMKGRPCSNMGTLLCLEMSVDAAAAASRSYNKKQKKCVEYFCLQNHCLSTPIQTL